MLELDHKEGPSEDHEKWLNEWVVGMLKERRSYWTVSRCLLLAVREQDPRKVHAMFRYLFSCKVGVFERLGPMRHAARAKNGRALLDHFVGDCEAQNVLD